MNKPVNNTVQAGQLCNHVQAASSATMFKLASSATMFKLASSATMFKPVNRQKQTVRFYVCVVSLLIPVN